MRAPTNYQISEREISFHPHSYGDPDGRLFWWNGQLYRAISQEKTPFFRQLFRGGVIQDLMDRGVLVPSELTELSLYGYGMVVRHRSVPFVSYPQEWCAAMLKDAALAYLDLVSELLPRGLTLRDAHPWNLLFEGSKPVYVDVTSIRAPTDDFKYLSYDKFCRYYRYPLMLMSQGQERIARHLLPDYEGILDSHLCLLTRKPVSLISLSSLKNRFATALEQRVPEAYRGQLKSGFRSVLSLFRKESRGQNSRLDYLRRLRSEIESIPLPDSRAERSNRDANSVPLSQDALSLIQQSLHHVITELRPDSLLVIGTKLGECSRSAALAGKKVVSFDKDSTYVTQLYYEARDKNLPLLPLVMDFTDPTPSRGLSSHLCVAAAERLQCDVVVALALVNQVVSERYLRFDQIVDGLAQFAKRWLIIDFIPRNISQENSHECSWYTRDNFFNALRNRFRTVTLLSSHRESYPLLLCEKEKSAPAASHSDFGNSVETR